MHHVSGERMQLRFDKLGEEVREEGGGNNVEEDGGSNKRGRNQL